MENKNARLWVLLGVLAVIIIIILVASSQGTKTSNQTGEPAEPGKPAAGTEQGTTSAVVDMSGAKAEIPGASLVTKDQKVVTAAGQLTQNSAIPNSPQAPKPVVVAKAQLPKQTISLEIGRDKITPNTFTVKSGQPVSLAVTSADGQAHVFIFTNSAVSAIALGVGPNETKAITFNAPVAGTYAFHDDIPGHQTVAGKMIVK